MPTKLSQAPSKPKKVKETHWQEISPGLYECRETGQRLARSEVYRLMAELTRELPADSPYRRVKALFGDMGR